MENKKKKSIGKILIVLIIIALVFGIFAIIFNPKAKEKTQTAIAKKAVDVLVENSDKIVGDNKTLQEIAENVTEEQKTEIAKILAPHVDAETMQKASTYIANKDKQSLINLATEKLSEEEILEIMKILTN